MRSLVEDLGLALVALGVGMVYLPAGVIVAGLALVIEASTHASLGRHADEAAPPTDEAAAPPGGMVADSWPGL